MLDVGRRAGSLGSVAFMVKLEIQFILGASDNGKTVVMFVKYLYLLRLLKPWRQVLLFMGF